MPRRRDERSGPTYFTTFQVAKTLGVSAPTVVNWINAGLVVAHKTPGGHRRIAREDLLEFARTHSYPVTPEMLGEAATPATSRRVLIVDDDEEFGAMVRDFLRHRGEWEVELAPSGFTAGVAVARFHPSVVLLDLMMPGMDGFEVLRVFKADPDMSRIPVVACSAWKDPAVEERVRREPFAAFVQKPIKLDALLAKLVSVVGERE